MRTENRKLIRIASLVLLFCVMNTLPLLAAGKMTIVIIKSSDISVYNSALAGFRDHLYKDRVDFDIMEYGLRERDISDISRDIKEIESHDPTLFVALGTSAAKVVQELVKNTPIVFSMVSEPLRSGIMAPGVSLDIEPALKLQKLNAILPGVKRIGLVYSEKSFLLRNKISELCAQLGFKLVDRKIGTEKEFADAVKGISEEIDCFMMIADSSVYSPKAVEFLLRYSLKIKLPVIGLSSVYTRAGALVSFDCDYKDIGAQTAEMALEVYVGKIDTARITAPQRVSFSVNLRVAETLGIQFPTKVLREASEVFGI